MKPITYLPRSQLKNSAKISNYLQLLSNEIYRYDSKMNLEEINAGKMPDIYRLGTWLESWNNIKKQMRFDLESSEMSTVMEFRALLTEHFDETLPPVVAMLEKIDWYLKQGIRPALAIVVKTNSYYVVNNWERAA